jgi:hypothetical protein
MPRAPASTRVISMVGIISCVVMCSRVIAVALDDPDPARYTADVSRGAGSYASFHKGKGDAGCRRNGEQLRCVPLDRYVLIRLLPISTYLPNGESRARGQDQIVVAATPGFAIA